VYIPLRVQRAREGEGSNDFRLADHPVGLPEFYTLSVVVRYNKTPASASYSTHRPLLVRGYMIDSRARNPMDDRISMRDMFLAAMPAAVSAIN
jgi:hypothetical protein